MRNPTPSPTPSPATAPASPPAPASPRRRRTALGLLAVLAAATLAGHLVSRRIGAAPDLGPGRPPDFGPVVASGPVSLSARLDRGAVLKGGDGLVRLELALTAEQRRGEQTQRVPTDLVVVLDRSGSMSGEKIELAKAAVAELVGQLGPGDRFALVTYSDGAELAVPLSAFDAQSRQRWRWSIQRVTTGGGTAMSAGLDTALAVTAEPAAGRAARIVLVSDGLANQGDASFEGLTARAARAARRETVVTAVGVGLDFDEHLMGALADAGTGNYYFLEQGSELAVVLARELEATRETVAAGLAVTLEPAPGVELVEAAGYPLERGAGGATFRPGSLFAGQERRVWLTLRVPSGRVSEHEIGRIVARFRDGADLRAIVLDGLPRIACVASEESFLQALDGDAWGEAVAEDEYNRLQKEVALDVKEGRQHEAQRRLVEFRSKLEQLNEAVGSLEVEKTLEAAEEMAVEVDDAFTGADQQMKQNRLSKSRQAAAWDGRRAGAKKTAPPNDKPNDRPKAP